MRKVRDLNKLELV